MPANDPERQKIGACLKEENLREIKEQLDDDTDAEKKKQGQMQCHGGGGTCQNRATAGKPPAAISDAGAGRLSDAQAAGRC